ncbi:MAG TPA: hypothetical protein VKA83_09380 [Methylomirabilota bacterium]|nr:hypothetical protein [Methylomirabilota bacterium]
MSEALANVLRDQIGAEQICRNRLLEIATSAHLTDAERLGVLEQAVEEIAHEQVFSAALARYDTPPDTRESVLAISDASCGRLEEPALRVADFRAVERKMRPSLRSARRAFAAAGDLETAAVYDRVIADEDAHAAFNKALYRRLAASPIGAALRARYAGLIHGHYTMALYRRALAG